MNQERDEGFYKSETQRPYNQQNTSQGSNRGNQGNTYQNPNSQYSPVKTKPAEPPKKKRLWVKGLAILVIAVLLIALFFGPMNQFLPQLWGGPVYPETAKFTIERTITISTNREINYTVNVPEPFDISGNDIQYIMDLELSGEPTIDEQYGQNWIFWANRRLDGGQIDEIIIKYQVETRTVKWGYSSQYSGRVDDIDQGLKDRYNRDQWTVTDKGEIEDRNGDGRDDVMIEPSHPTIINLAQQITEDEDNLYDKSRAIYRWITRNIDYQRGTSGLPKHAYWTLDTRSGDCDEQAFLFISLARAVDIPAWIELGVLYDRVLNEWGGHGWIRMEFVDDEGSSGWVNIDTTNNQFFARDATRITTWIDDGIEGHLEDYYYYLNYNYTSGAAPRVSVNEQYKNLQMETEGQVYLGDGGSDIPWIGTAIMAPTVVLFSLIWEKKKKR